ncbi:STAS domain-containing protein [Mycolicibacterium sediminis]|uniref:Anti-sigma factor antagonist n=1 Tax=Mycolicibacterium sediminis TaxID=1286180 RepID=A0A7I7QP42_9MYCO|nr:STAS domain-containing protein [Mycolicibacterium sediminis]BBY27982.1 hypothetical protein MSEDJ_20780 [Mycolicibacterium sediminis]
MPRDLLTTRVRRLAGDITVLSVDGEIDLATAGILDAAVADATATASHAVVVDLTGVDFMGSAGLRILAQTHERLVPTTFVVVTDRAATRRPIEVTGLTELFSTFATLDAALAAVRRDPDDS